MRKILIIGAGPAGIFTALELVKLGSKDEITIIEQGHRVENRVCPKTKTKECIHCKPYCNITSGFSGAGAFSDGKLSLSHDVGGDFPNLVGEDVAQDLIDYTDKIYLEFGADSHVEGAEETDEIREIRKSASIAGLKLVDCPIRHLGTEKAHALYLGIEKFLEENGVKILADKNCSDIVIENGVCKGAVVDGEIIYADKIVVATGRKGAEWLDEMCRVHGIGREAGVVDIGVRVEVRNEIMEKVNKALYESKLIGYPQPFGNKVRTFCQNPGGFVAQENYDNDLAVVNGHSFKETKSNNTNLAILCSHRFTYPFDDPIAYAQKVGEMANMLGSGHILVQRLGDIKAGKRTWQEELSRTNLKPTLSDAIAGDITAAIPYRTMVCILNFIEQMDKVVPGFASDETLLYAPELKFYSNRVKMDKNLNTNVKNLQCLGDASGWTRGLMMASTMGVYCARQLMK
jgi:hypothetical protein